MGSTSRKRIKVIVSGIVQGVGFRPFVHKTATSLSLVGHVNNSGSGVEIEVEGTQEDVSRFMQQLRSNHPSLAKISSVKQQSIELKGESSFSIIASQATTPLTNVSPDVSMCQNCKQELFDPTSRFYLYPFVNCTDCGPRYTIMKKLPYDRVNSSMAQFAMCITCNDIYHDIHSRRYHAQPLSCKDCGPTLTLYDNSGKVIRCSDPIKSCAEMIEKGKIVAIKGLGGFHLVCDATNENAVQELRERKKRVKKPLAVMFATLQKIKQMSGANKKELELIGSQQRPIVIVPKKKSTKLAPSIAPNIDKIGVFLPYTPLHEILLSYLKNPIVATSANMSETPISTQTEDVFSTLRSVVDRVLTHDREIINGCDDSVMQIVYGHKSFLRLARGFAPQTFFMQEHVAQQKILAVGAQQKSTIALGFGNNIILSPHIGDLSSIDSMEYFQKTIDTFFRFYNFTPDVIICDKHLGYESTRWAQEYVKSNSGVSIVTLQHHYAHALSVMAEYELEQDVLAFCFDGTGLGDDGTLWGGEVLKANRSSYERLYSFESTKLLGGENAIKEPRKIALSILFDLFSLDEVLALDHLLVKSFTTQEIKLLHQMHSKCINAPDSSSVGRLFDAIYAFCGYLSPVSYEGESGMVLETLSKDSDTKQGFDYVIERGVIRYKSSMFRELLHLQSSAEISKRFFNMLCDIIMDIVKKHDNMPVVFCGGVFQNATLITQLLKRLKMLKIKYYIQEQSAINDGSIALGQVYYALKRGKSEK